MIELIAKENATIKTTDNRFPLGQQTTATVHIQDKYIIDALQVSHTGSCDTQYNYFSYGLFQDIKYANKYITKELNHDCIADIVEGEGYKTTNALMCFAPEGKELGKVTLQPDIISSFEPSKKYILSCKVRLMSGELSLDISNQNIPVNLSRDEWFNIRSEFTADTTDCDLNIDLVGGKCYISDIKLFESQYELNDTDALFKTEIKILNPCNYDVNINKVANWQISEENVDVVLGVPPITVVDFQDNLLCKFIISRTLPKRSSYLDNIVYNRTNSVIYESEPFTLRGYIIPPGLDVTKVSVVTG